MCRSTVFIAVCFALLVCLASTPLIAGRVITSPQSATASLPTETTYPTSAIDKIVDQSGLLSPFLNGISDFDQYLLTNPLHDGHRDHCYSSENSFFGSGVVIDLDMGQPVLIDALAIWNGNVNNGANPGTGINQFRLLSGNTPGFGDAIDHGFFSIQPAGYPIAAEVVTLPAPTTATYLRLEVLTNHGNPGHYSVSEIAVGVLAVPEPSTFILLTIGAAGLLVYGWRRRRCIDSMAGVGAP